MPTVRVSGVTQQSVPGLERVSQAPPEAVYTAELKLKFVPVLATANTCGRASPPSGMLKAIGFTWAKTLAPTMTLTGIVTTSFPVCNTTWPSKVPVVAPPPGMAAGIMLTVKVEGAVPLGADSFSQLPPSAVLPVAVHFSVPVPPFRMATAWGAGVSLVVR
jgi:hypothetical protein